MLVISISGLALSVYLFFHYRKKNIYNITLNKLLRDYDRIIVNGQIDIDEKKYSNKVYPEKFTEVVDASQNVKMTYDPYNFANIISDASFENDGAGRSTSIQFQTSLNTWTKVSNIATM